MNTETKSLAILAGRTLPKYERPYISVGREERDAVVQFMDSGAELSGFSGRAGDRFLGGVKVRELEREVESFFGVKFAVSFNSATTALQASVGALGIGPGDEVVTSPFTMAATATAILLNNAIPVFADIDPMRYGLDPQSVERCITPRTKAIMSVNIFGGSPDYDALRAVAKRHDLKIIEDNAQSSGAVYRGRLLGTIGDVSVMSLNVHKIIQCGEGGVLVTNDEHIARRAQLLRNHGEVAIDDLEGHEVVLGSNYRFSELHAVIAIEQFKKLHELNRHRQQQAGYLTARLSELDFVRPYVIPEDETSVYYVYPIQFDIDRIGLRRRTIVAALSAEGFPTPEGYVKPLHLLPLFQDRRAYPNSKYPFDQSSVSYARGICPVAERMYFESLVFTTIFQPPNGREEIDAFVDAIRRIGEYRDALRNYEQSSES
jgi:perosamine synthetase